MAAIQVNVRFPELLLARIASASNNDGKSQWILEACRMRLDGNSAGSSVAEQRPHKTQDVGSNPAPPTKPDIQALRDICAGKIAVTEHEPQAEIPMCMKTWWEDGELYECLMDKGHKELKHGQRTMVRKIDQ